MRKWLVLGLMAALAGVSYGNTSVTQTLTLQVGNIYGIEIDANAASISYTLDSTTTDPWTINVIDALYYYSNGGSYKITVELSSYSWSAGGEEPFWLNSLQVSAANVDANGGSAAAPVTLLIRGNDGVLAVTSTAQDLITNFGTSGNYYADIVFTGSGVPDMSYAAGTTYTLTLTYTITAQ